MPCISDPGEELIRQCAEKGIKTEVVPGPSAVISALCVSGLATGRFTFEGFLSVNKKSRRDHLESLRNETRTMIFYEAPHKLLNTLRDFYETFSVRKLTIARELTKLHEEIIRTNTEDALRYVEENGIKGEIVLVLEGKPLSEGTPEYTLEDAVSIARELIESGERATDAAKEAAKITGLKKNEIYRELI